MYSSVNSTCGGCKIRFNASHKKMVVLHPCGHIYHKECWIESNACPICHVNITDNQQEDELLPGSQELRDVASLRRNNFEPNL